jgi:hypothetical protein
MTSIDFRPPYTKDELNKLYPKDLELRLVQVLLRHGERAPVSARFGNVGNPGLQVRREEMCSQSVCLGRFTSILAVLQCGATTALGRHDA